MSDFTNNFWSVCIAAISVVSIAACLLLLWITARKKVPFQSDNTTGHVWDGDLREMNNPLPRWWVGLFILTILFSIGYLAFYPGLGNFAGKLGWTSANEYSDEVKTADAALQPLYANFVALPPEQLAGSAPAMAIGERLFMNNCAQCHGSDARGSKGFPNLTDGDWLHGGSPEKIKETITHGRIGQMPVMAPAVGTPDDVKNVANYVLSLSGSPHDSVRAGLGKAKFGVCAACHGVGGTGNQALGAPNLSDDIWLHGWGEAAIMEMVNKGKINQMPAQQGKLTEAQIHVLTAYIWGLSNKPVVSK
ncbi:MAG: cytochrome-c oxidase, cbb3-type subunit III [Burkholderiales bacterium]|nr:cytochrome-c oxidase, cbb3-type subunit III [Burkholderiales bacterium]